MTRTAHRLGRLAGLFTALSLVFGYATAPLPAAAAEPAATAVPAWDGSIDLYRDGVFTTQKSWLWCTAAGVQIIRNIVDGEEDHSVSAQRRYFNWMREHNRYTLPLSAGVDPQGWTAGLRHFVDDRYRLVTSTTFDNALRSAVKRLRLTNLPVALTVAHGNHGWILTGFAATADPSVTASFKVTSVRIVGPLYGLQSRNGYDMPPDTKLTPSQLKRYFTPWKYPPKAMMWDGRYVSIQPVPATASTGAATGGPPAAGATAPRAPMATVGSEPAERGQRRTTLEAGPATTVVDALRQAGAAERGGGGTTAPDGGGNEGTTAQILAAIVVTMAVLLGAGLFRPLVGRSTRSVHRPARGTGAPPTSRMPARSR